VDTPVEEKPWPRAWADLDEQTREKVLDQQRNWNVDHNWWEYIYGDATCLGLLMGITVDNISFSGFWSQGDGACYDGRYSFKPGAGEAIRAECDDEELARIADELALLQTTLKLQADVQVGAVISTRGSYSHSGTMYFDFEFGRDLEDSDPDIEPVTSELAQLLRDFADWIYRQLEAEYEHLTSDETLTEIFSDAAHQFDEDGSII
jgi:hypothetical protein